MTTLTQQDIDRVSHDALVRRAMLCLNPIEDRHAAYDLHQRGRTQRQIAAILHISQPRVQRMLAFAKQHGDAVTANELILRAAVYGTNRHDLVDALSAMAYSFDEKPATTASRQPNAWIQVQIATSKGLLTAEEYERVRDAIQPPDLLADD